MKTTIEISDDLIARSQKSARLQGRTLRDLVEQGLRLALEASARRPKRAAFEFPKFGQGGLQPEFEGAGWEALRDAAYERNSRPGA